MTERAIESVAEVTSGRSELESSRVRVGFDAAVAYRELVDLATALPLGAGPTAIIQKVIVCLATLLPHRAIGTCFVAPSTEAPLIELYLPVGVARPGRDPTRLFPELPDERILELGGFPGSTLHVASTAGSFDDDSAEQDVITRAAALLAAGLRTALALRAARPASAEVAELRSQMIQSEKLATLGQLVAGVVHELANPVTSIVACADLLLKKTRRETPPEEVEHVRRIGMAADRILKFSRDLVAYARPASETPGPVALHEVIAQARAFCDHEFGRSGVTFTSDYVNGAPPILGQSGPLTQVFVNLFTNATHAMNHHGGRLEVRSYVLDGDLGLCVDVTDTGIGIPPEVIPKIFEPFFTTKPIGRGTGLGLSIVREIVVAHGGTIEAKSTLGEGTTFSVLLPLFPKP